MTLKLRIAAIATVIATSLAIAACGSSSTSSGGSGASGGSSSSSSGGKSTVNGAGSTLAAPIYQQWGSTLSGQGVTLNYNPVGSGTGVADLQTATVDFAGSDPAATRPR
jgi:phosphate transport system substrate-binding protein